MSHKRLTALFVLGAMLLTGCSGATQMKAVPAVSTSSITSSTAAGTEQTAPSTGDKTIIPFTVHGGSGFAGTRQTIAELKPGATIVNDGLSISRNSVAEAEASVVDWVRGLELNK